MTAFDSILHDHSITVVNAGKRMLQGVGICVGIGIMGYFHKSAEKKLITDRTIGQDWYVFFL